MRQPTAGVASTAKRMPIGQLSETVGAIRTSVQKGKKNTCPCVMLAEAPRFYQGVVAEQ